MPISSYIESIKNISLQNKYLNWYISLCEKAHVRSSSRKDATQICGYVEGHHILPKSFNMGGDRDKDNVVYFSAREHYIAHKLLIKFLVDRSLVAKMTKAWMRMLYSSKDRQQLYKISSRDFELFKMENNKNCSGINSPNYGKLGKKRSLDTRQRMSESRKGTSFTAEHRQNLSNASKGKIQTDEHNRNISNGRKGIKFTEAHIKNMAKGHVGLKHSKETRKLMSAKKQGKNNPSYGNSSAKGSKRVRDIVTNKKTWAKPGELDNYLNSGWVLGW